MKVLVAIANFGTRNDGYLRLVLDEYRRMAHQVDIVVNTNLPKDLGPDVEVRVGLPHKDPRSLPFAHKSLFAERSELYDLFIYTEDDILITQRNIDAFLRVTAALPENELAGFLRTEMDSQGKIYFPDIHKQYHWDPMSLRQLGRYSFAFFTNEHAGCYALTNKQLARALTSGGFLVGFHEGKYEPLESAATDPYVQCGFRKAICVSDVSDFIVPHLSNKYAGNADSVTADDVHRQLSALSSLGGNGTNTLFPVETKLYHERWSKSYYERSQTELLSLVPDRTGSLLSVGCGWGDTEHRLMEKGIRVKAIPMDSVIAASATSRGISVVCGDAQEAREKLADESFDCLLFSNVLHLVRNPVDWLASFAELLNSGGCVVASAPNLTRLRRLSRSLRFPGQSANPRTYDKSGMHVTTKSVITKWFREAGLRINRVVYSEPEGYRMAKQFSWGLPDSIRGSTLYVSGVLTKDCAGARVSGRDSHCEPVRSSFGA